MIIRHPVLLKCFIKLWPAAILKPEVSKVEACITILVEQCRTVGDLGDIYLCDWSQYLVGQKSGSGGGLQFAQSIHLKFDYDQTAYRFVFRVDGQPLWKSAITPLYGSNTAFRVDAGKLERLMTGTGNL